MKIIFLLMSVIVLSGAVKPIALQYSGIKVKHTYSNGEEENYKIEREIHKKCLDIPVSSESFSKENIKNNIPKECKKTIISSKGVIQPLYINKDIKTYSELEVMYFIFNKSTKKPTEYILVDSRKESWFDLATIPSAVNIPFGDLKYDEDFEDDFKKAYKNLGVKVLKENKLDFSNAKTAVFFCNGAWCPLSSKSIQYLSFMGYPKEKLIWYRGGIASWQALNLTLTKKLK